MEIKQIPDLHAHWQNLDTLGSVTAQTPGSDLMVLNKSVYRSLVILLSQIFDEAAGMFLRTNQIPYLGIKDRARLGLWTLGFQLSGFPFEPNLEKTLASSKHADPYTALIEYHRVHRGDEQTAKTLETLVTRVREQEQTLHALRAMIKVVNRQLGADPLPQTSEETTKP
jgi:hypothetical protein